MCDKVIFIIGEVFSYYRAAFSFPDTMILVIEKYN